MPTVPAPTRQTTKQAKAAFKARGSTHVSSTERRKLERGAQLLERADKAKAQERRKKEWMKKREEQGNQQKSDEGSKVLGSQLRLDKFGYKSSQFHLGRFFGPPKTHAQSPKLSSKTEDENGENMDEYADDDDFDEHTLLELDPSTNNSSFSNHDQDHSTHGATDWSYFLESSTQIARELSGDMVQESVMPQNTSKTSGRSRSLVSVPSWNSDEAFGDEDLAELDDQVESVQRQIRTDKDKLLMPPPRMSIPSKPSAYAFAMLPPSKRTGSGKSPSSRPSIDGMPPPPPPPAKTSAVSMPPPAKPFTFDMPSPPIRPVSATNFRSRNVVSAAPFRSHKATTIQPLLRATNHAEIRAGEAQSRKDDDPSLASYGISAADLEILAADDIVLSQWSGG